jgi:hypothetical protein
MRLDVGKTVQHQQILRCKINTKLERFSTMGSWLSDAEMTLLEVSRCIFWRSSAYQVHDVTQGPGHWDRLESIRSLSPVWESCRPGLLELGIAPQKV